MAAKKEKIVGLTKNKDEQIGVNSPDFIKIYANNAQVGFSLWDMSIIFGEIVGEQEGKAVVEQKVKVNMSKEMAKVLTIILNQNLNAYETQFGEIKLIQMTDMSKMPNEEK